MLVDNEAGNRNPVSAAHIAREVVTEGGIQFEERSFVLGERQLVVITALGRQSEAPREPLCARRTIAKDGQRRRIQKAHQKRPACLKHGFTSCLCLRRANPPPCALYHPLVHYKCRPSDILALEDDRGCRVPV